MDRKYILSALVGRITDRSHFTPSQVSQSLQQLASRWTYVLDYHEKKAIARALGGNKYAKTTHLLLDTLFEEVLIEDSDTDT
jgi:hypothetical protein